jgi:hypothetical protein
MVHDPKDVVWSNLLKYRKLRLPSVCTSHLVLFTSSYAGAIFVAKFQQYMYGGRPLGRLQWIVK